MNWLCRVGLHRWKIVRRYVPGGFLTSVWPGITGRSYHEYKGERCMRCRKWRNENVMHWWQWLGWVMLLTPILSPIVWVCGWGALGVLALLVVAVAICFIGLMLVIE